MKTAANSGAPATVGALAERLQLPQTSVTELVTRAEPADLVHGNLAPIAASATSPSPRRAMIG